MTVNSRQVWQALMKDPEFAAQPKSVLEATRPFIDALPKVLAGQLNEVADISHLMKAKIEFLRYCSDNGFIKAVVDATPDGALGFFDRDTVSTMMTDMFSQLIEMLEPLSVSAVDFIRAHGVTEEQFMTGSGVGLRGKALSEYKARKLTIGRVLELQPIIIVKNSK